eukprot:GFYU01011783.1.p1 GENE.GFYU01011783.1~~GFYU01011783.1.p1  ORF type:complete len:411 (+),score=76.87 GFYU01011783.1:236-1468(+)
MLQYLHGTYALSRFYLRNLLRLRHLPPLLKNSNELMAMCAKNESFVIEAPRITADKYNKEYDELKQEIKSLGERDRPFTSTMYILLAVRMACVAAAWMGDLHTTIFLSCLQFYFAPYSFFVSMTLLVALAPPMYFGHYLTFTGFRLIQPFMPEFMSYSFTITTEWIILYFVVDQLLCVLCTFWTPEGQPKGFDFKTTMVHVVYGNLNCKTYHLMLLPLLRGVEIDMTLWVLDALLGISTSLSVVTSHYFMHWTPLFYHQHRIAHLPRVYEHAHKFHHYLHGTNAFDAHIYGSGAPEEWPQLMLELMVCLGWKIAPATLGWHVLKLSWSNKVGHTRKVEDDWGSNHHPDHHTIHSKNFSIFGGALDLYFSTNSNNEKQPFYDYMMERELTDDVIRINFRYRGPKNAAVKGS